MYDYGELIDVIEVRNAGCEHGGVLKSGPPQRMEKRECIFLKEMDDQEEKVYGFE